MESSHEDTASAKADSQGRAFPLIQKYCQGSELTAAEWSEVYAAYPKFSPGGPVPCAAPKLELTPEPSPAHGDSEVTGEQLKAWSNLYKRSARNIRKWIARGKDVCDPCPLDDPAKMPGWWARHMKWSVPDSITGAAAVVIPPLVLPPSPELSAPPTVQPPPMEQTGPPINLSEFDLQQGEAVQQQRRIVGALYSQLEKAYLGGTNADVIQQKYNKAVEALRKLEKDDRADQEARGQLIPRQIVERDIAAAGDMLRQMRESMERRILELCPSLTTEQRAQVADAIRRVRSAEDRVFQRLHTIKSEDDLLAELSA